ncbi:hypothetical protein HPG69_002119 [Diceros bicornis minor]|uniref:Uncharacterized protein n=1 Tax=Diceros bicornis minor TaxID=77932 RepID=A0A7J7FCE0_DICBM|nr:hypothetical protein HPG69_002119 [Diceros bicornis minor]
MASMPTPVDRNSSTLTLHPVTREDTSGHGALYIATSQPSDLATYLCAVSIDVSGGTGAQSVTQPDNHITASERARLALRCNYSTSLLSYLFWKPSGHWSNLAKYFCALMTHSAWTAGGAEHRTPEKL